MSGTSLDGVDGVLLDLSEANMSIIAYATAPFAPDLTQEMLSLNHPGPNELHRAALAGNALVRVYAKVVTDLLTNAGIKPTDVRAIGAHGQTVRHQPQAFGGSGYTLQLNSPALLAELTGIDVIADFRSRDVAAGGQGAPLVPAFHQSVFGRQGDTVAILNVGGISNLTVLGPQLTDDVLGLDCGPGNALMDGWCQQHLGHAFDAEGAWAASGQVHSGLLESLLAEPYFALAAPKSTGRDLFNRPWLDAKLKPFSTVTPVDIQTTLTELTASACASCVKRYAFESTQLIVCGGGAFNIHLMNRLQAHLPTRQVSSSQTQGIAPLQVEAAAFAWLARKAVLREPLQLKKITGAKGARILGALYPA